RRRWERKAYGQDLGVPCDASAAQEGRLRLADSRILGAIETLDHEVAQPGIVGPSTGISPGESDGPILLDEPGDLADGLRHAGSGGQRRSFPSARGERGATEGGLDRDGRGFIPPGGGRG